MIRIPKIYLYREDGSHLFFSGLPTHMSVVSFNYTEAEGTGTDVLKVKLNVSEAYYGSFKGLIRKTPILFSYGYMQWQSPKVSLAISNITSTYGNEGYVVEIEAKPLADILEESEDPRETIEDIYKDIKLVVQVNARVEEITEIPEPKTEIQPGPTIVVGGAAGGAVPVVTDTYDATIMENYNLAVESSVEISTGATLDSGILEGLKQGVYKVINGQLVKVKDPSSMTNAEDVYSSGVTTHDDKIILLASQGSRINTPSHSFYPNSHIINIVFTSKEKSTSDVEAVNASIDPDNKSESIDNILSKNGYKVMEGNVGSTDIKIKVYQNKKTKDIYQASTSGDNNAIVLTKETDNKLSELLSQDIEKKEKEQAEYDALTPTQSGSYYTKEDGSTGVVFQDDNMGSKGKIIPNADSEVRSDMGLFQTQYVPSFVTQPTVNVDPENLLRTAIEDIDIGNALVGAIEDENFYRNTATIQIEGKPTVREGQTIKIGGFANVFTGLYLVRKVVHQITTGGYISTITSTKVPNTYEISLEKGKAQYGQMVESIKKQVFETSFKQYEEEIDRLNEAVKNGAILSNTQDGATTKYSTDPYLVSAYIGHSASDVSNYKIDKDKMVVSTKDAVIKGEAYSVTGTTSHITDVSTEEYLNVNPKYQDSVYNSDYNLGESVSSDAVNVNSANVETEVAKARYINNNPTP